MWNDRKSVDEVKFVNSTVEPSSGSRKQIQIPLLSQAFAS